MKNITIMFMIVTGEVVEDSAAAIILMMMMTAVTQEVDPLD